MSDMAVGPDSSGNDAMVTSFANDVKSRKCCAESRTITLGIHIHTQSHARTVYPARKGDEVQEVVGNQTESRGEQGERAAREYHVKAGRPAAFNWPGVHSE